jgi:sugar O-acyltransferase (sialic acid O-acetyltransferase NeuD family)
MSERIIARSAIWCSFFTFGRLLFSTTASMPPRVTYLIGAGGHAKVIADILIASGRPPTAFLDDAPTQNRILGITVIKGLELPQPDSAVIVAVGDNATRQRLAHRYSTFDIAIHPSAVVSRDAEIGPGTVVMAGAVINTGARVGSHCIINTGSIIDHDCLISDFAHIAPGAKLGGNVRVGVGSMVGLGANVIHGRCVGDHTIVGAGSTVVRDVPPRVVAIGSPARAVRTRAPDDRYL